MKTYVDTVGGKGKSLIWLKKSGFTVPDFYILQSSFFKDMPDAESEKYLAAKLQQILNENNLVYPMAVRSSANAEDGAEYSFAGLFETVLNVTDLPSLIAAVQKVRLSQSSDRVRHYGKNAGLKDFEMSVILQKMVCATEAGVLFTANPVNGKRSEMMVSAVHGLAEKLVSGEVSGETIILGFGAEVVGPKPVETLKPTQLRNIYQLGQMAAKKFGRPLDIEWAFEGEKLFFLQARPITSALVSESKNPIVFDNSNIQESYCGITTPLTFSYASEAYCQVYNQLMKLMGFSVKEIQKAQQRHQHLLGYINGRVYYNINCWYQGLLYLPNFGRRKDDMEKMMGVEKPVDFVTDYKISKTEKLARVLPMILLIARMVYRFSKIDQDVQRFDQWFWKLYKKYDRANLQFLDTEELTESLYQLQTESLEEWAVPVLNDFLVMANFGSLKREMDRVGMGQHFQDVIKGSDLVSLEPTIELKSIAADFFKMTEPEFEKKVENHIELFGDRSMGELKLETQTYRQDPSILKDLIQQMTKANSSKNSFQEKFEAQEHEFFKVYRLKMGYLKTLRIQKKVKKLKKAIADRELMRFHRTRIFGMMRSYYLEIGKRLLDLKVLDNEKDIFYITRDEVFDFFNGKSATAGLKSLVQLRKNESRSFEKIDMPPQISISHPIGHWMQFAKQEKFQMPTSDLLQGLGCSSGKIRGLVRFISNPQESHDLEGCILLAERTDPGWTPLFTLVKGVIIERGSALSHSAIIAREMGIPAVVGVLNATKILQNGDEVEIDGNTGGIKIIRTARTSETRSFQDHQSIAK